MFGGPTSASDGDAIFYRMWMYTIKVVNGRKKAQCVYDSSTCSGQVLVVAKTYVLEPSIMGTYAKYPHYEFHVTRALSLLLAQWHTQ
jgi:hypothetical protein